MAEGFDTNILRFGLAEIVAVTLAPFAVCSRKSLLGEGANTLTMPKLGGEINPLFMPVAFAGRRSEQLVYAGKGLIK